MGQKSIVRMAAWFEIVVGVILIIVPDVPSLLLFASKPEAAGEPFARWAGIALVALGIACLPSGTSPHRSVVLGLFAFNAGIVLLLLWVGIATTLHGFLLWPAAILHVVIAASLLPQLLTTASAHS